MGRAALEQRKRALTFFVFGWSVGAFFLGLSVLATILDWGILIPLCVSLCALGAIPMMVLGAVCMNRTTQLIVERYGFPKKTKWTITKKALKMLPVR
jgi:LytS/YehU family sensor histidine kinase